MKLHMEHSWQYSIVHSYASNVIKIQMLWGDTTYRHWHTGWNHLCRVATWPARLYTAFLSGTIKRLQGLSRNERKIHTIVWSGI